MRKRSSGINSFTLIFWSGRPKGLGGVDPDCRPRHIVKAAKKENFMNYIKQIRSAEQFSSSRTKPLETFACHLVNTESYVESFEIKPIALQKNVVELVIKTQLLSAKDPSEWRVKSRTCVELDSLKELQKIIASYLKKQPSSPHEPQ